MSPTLRPPEDHSDLKSCGLSVGGRATADSLDLLSDLSKPQRSADEVPQRLPGERMIDFAYRRATYLGYKVTPPKLVNLPRVWDDDLIPQIEVIDGDSSSASHDPQRSADEVPQRPPGERMIDFAHRRATYLGYKVTPPKLVNLPRVWDDDLIPQIEVIDGSHQSDEMERVISAVDCVAAYNRWSRKPPVDALGKTRNIMISCPIPGHADLHPSADINLEVASDVGGVWHCHACGQGGDKYDIAAFYFGFPVPDYKKTRFPELRQRMAETLGVKPLAHASKWPTSNTSMVPSSRTTTSDTSRSPVQRLTLVAASSVKMKRVSWLWDGRIPIGALTLTPGRGGIGKSTFHAWLIAVLTRGILLGCYFGTPKSVIVAATEDSWEYTIAPRLVAAGADLERVFRIEVTSTQNGDGVLNLPSDLNELADLIRANDVALMSVDPLMAFLSETIDSHRDKEVRSALQPLTKMAEETGCAILGNAHFTKSGTDPMSSIMGSAAFGNVARAAIAFAKDDDAGVGVMSQVKNNLGRVDGVSLRYKIVSTTVQTEDGPSEVGKLVWDGTSDRSVGDILSDTRSSQDRVAGQKATTFVLEYVTQHGGTVPAAEVLAAGTAEGHSERTLSRARKDVGIVTQQKNGYHQWSLPPDHDLIPNA